MDSHNAKNKEEPVLNNKHSRDTANDINNNIVSSADTFNDNIAEKSYETTEWTFSSLFGKLTELQTCLTLIQNNSIALQNYFTATVKGLFCDPESPVSSRINSPLLSFPKDRIALEKAVKNLANVNTDLVYTASLVSPIGSYYSLKTAESKDDIEVMETDPKVYKVKKSSENPKDDTIVVDDNVPSNPVSNYSEYSTVKRIDGNSATPLNRRLNRRNSSLSGDNKKKGCCNCFGSKKKKSDSNKKSEDCGTSTMSQNSNSSPVMAVAPLASTIPLLAINSAVPVVLPPTAKQSSEITQYPLFRTPTVRRIRVANRPNIPLSLWSILKNCIGKDITKMPLPVNFSEPLSMLQRLTEDYEYSEILDVASKIEDSCEQMVYVAAFTISSYATTTLRTNKPFNPLLGETFECDRTKDLGWRCINEKVVHHPPCIAQHCTGKSWTCWQQFSMTSKFHTNYLSVIPLGTSHLSFGGEGGNHYTWRKVSTVVHNIMFGKLWVGQEGDMTIVNHTDGTTCVLKYFPPESGGNDAPKKVAGDVFNKKKELKWKIFGLWDTGVEACEVLQITPEKLGPKKKLWNRVFPPVESEKYYNFTQLACQLNEVEEGIAPTDSRLRPDQRFMEDGLWDEANNEKLRLEDKQRTTRRKYSQDSKSNLEGKEPGYTPAWFTHITDPLTGIYLHIYNGEYWPSKDKQDWSRCPNIYS